MKAALIGSYAAVRKAVGTVNEIFRILTLRE